MGTMRDMGGPTMAAETGRDEALCEDHYHSMRVKVTPACAAAMQDYSGKLWRRWKREGLPQDEGAKRGPAHAVARIVAWFLALSDEDRQRIQAEGERLRLQLDGQDADAESLPYPQLGRSIIGPVELPPEGEAEARPVGASHRPKDGGRDRQPIGDHEPPDAAGAPPRGRRQRR